MTATPPAVGTDAVLRSLASERRRRVLRILADADGTATIDQLVASLRRATPDDPGAPRDWLDVDLVHVHLPQLRDGGLVDYDPHLETVRYAADPWVEEVMRACSSR